MSVLAEAVLLPSIFLTVTLLGGLRIGASVTLLPPSIVSLILAALMLTALIRAAVIVPHDFVRQQALNRLKEVELPPNVQPAISPAGTISEIYRYQLVGPPNIDLIELRTLQDWVVERRLRLVPGVSDVLVLGGKTKEFQAEIDLNRMIAHGLTQISAPL